MLYKYFKELASPFLLNIDRSREQTETRVWDGVLFTKPDLLLKRSECILLGI